MDGTDAGRGLVGGTLGSDVLHRMRDDIISCRIKPGERLPFEKLRGVYGASFSTLREALTSLAAEKLVTTEGQKGFQVAPVTRQELTELTDLRVLVEQEAIKLSVRNGDEAWEASVLSAYHRLERCQSRLGLQFTQFPEWMQRHQEFHRALAGSSKSEMLSHLREQLFERAHRYRTISAAHRVDVPAKKAEHRDLMEVVLARQESVALQLIEGHIRETSANIMEKAAALLG